MGWGVGSVMAPSLGPGVAFLFHILMPGKGRGLQSNRAGLVEGEGVELLLGTEARVSVLKAV